MVLDPVDGSTNASLGIPWFATSLCVLDDDGARVALVVNQALGVRYEARARRRGARRTAGRSRPRAAPTSPGPWSGSRASRPPRPRGWAQTRALGSAALDHCLVAEGVLDGYVVGGRSPSRTAGTTSVGMLVCQEAGACVAEAQGRELVVRDASPRRPVAAATAQLTERLLG